jgi:hypothetical protein
VKEESETDEREESHMSLMSEAGIQKVAHLHLVPLPPAIKQQLCMVFMLSSNGAT